MANLKNILSGPSFSSSSFQDELENTSLDEYLMNEIEKRNNDTIMINAETGEKLTWKELKQRSYNLAAELQALGCNKNTVVGIISENRFEYAIAISAVILTGAALTCFKYHFNVDELRSLYDIMKPKIMFCSGDNYDKVKQVASSTSKIIVFDSNQTTDVSFCEPFEELMKSSKVYNKVTNHPDQVVFIPYSSGTTAFYKGIMLTHKNVVFILKLLREENLRLVKGGANVMSFTPMSHISGLISILNTLAADDTLVFMQKHDERLYLSAIEKYNVTYMVLISPMISLLIKSPIVNEYNLTSVEHVVCGGTSIKAEVEQALINRLGLKSFQQMYGLTETTTISTMKYLRIFKSGTCGSAIPGTQIKIVHLETEEILGKNETGEIYVRGPHVMKGYFGDEKATAEILDKEGWLRTGDIGYYDDDGDLFIVDRVKEVMKCEGQQVTPTELETLLLTHPSISEVAVIGIPHESYCEVPKAFVVKRDKTIVMEDEIIQFLAEKVKPYKQLRGGVEFVTELPKNASGKISRRSLRERINNGTYKI